ncbi:MAG: hypothetical protein MR877_09185 [Spirochaetia bacterium]|nr:hypothetical protein [Spirochaetia bacterium]
MKLVKLFNKLSAVALAASLVVGFASCSTTTDDPFNPNAPLTLEEYVKSEIKKAIDNGGAQAKPEDPSKPGKPSGSLKEPKSLEFHVNADSTNAENTMIFVKYDRSAYGAEEEVKVTDAELNLYINDEKVKTYNEIVFALDQYGDVITSRGPIEDPKAMKEYKAKLSVGKAVKSGETVKIELVKASVVKVGAASDKITLADLQFALIDTDESVKYYKELAPNAEQFQKICTLEDLTTGEDTESKPGEEQKPGSGEKPAVKSIKLIKNEYAQDPQTQVKIPSELTSLSVGDKVKVAFSGTADREIGNVELMIVDTTREADYWTALSETKKDNFSTDINFDFEFVIIKAPIGTGADSMVLAINGLDSDKAATIKCTSFSIEKIANEKPAGGENNAGGEGDNGAGESTSKTYGLCKKYTVTTTKDVVAGDFAFVLQIDNDGEQSADGLKIDVTDFEMEVQVGDEKPFTYKNPKIQMIPNAHSNPKFAKTDCRFVLDKNKAIGKETVITVQVKKATVSNKAKADSIIYVFNEDGANKTNPSWGQYVSDEDNYKPIFAANEI